jgi:hypothetical protein
VRGVARRNLAHAEVTVALVKPGINAYFYVNTLDEGGVLRRDSGERCDLFLATRHFIVRAIGAACGLSGTEVAAIFDSDDKLLHRGAYSDVDNPGPAVDSKPTGGGATRVGGPSGGTAPALPPAISLLRGRHSLRSRRSLVALDAALPAFNPSRLPSRGVHIYMPLFATGIDQLTSHEACLVQISAIGDLAAEMRRRRMVVPEITVRLPHCDGTVSHCVMANCSFPIYGIYHDVPVGPRPD